jgi:hypothetical protein
MIQVLSFPPRIKYGVNSGGNPGQKYWIPGQARNDKQTKVASDNGAVGGELFLPLGLQVVFPER